MIAKFTHVGVAVKNLNESLKVFLKLFNVESVETEMVPNQEAKIAFLRIGDSSIELIEGTSPNSNVAKFIGKRGEGIHHLSFEVDDIQTEIKRLTQEGFQFVDEQPRVGASGHLIAFLHPKSTNGVLIELSQKE